MRAITITITALMKLMATTPPMMATEMVETVVMLECSVVVLLARGEHSPSLRDEIATEHSVSTVISTPVTMILAPSLTHFSIREVSEPLSASEVPVSLARYVTYVGDSGKQANDGLSMMSLVIPHLAHAEVSSSNTALVTSSNFSLLSMVYNKNHINIYCYV